MAQQFLACPCCFAALARLTALQRGPYGFAHRLDGLLETRPRQPAVLELVPQMKQGVALFQQTLANGFARLAPVDHRLEVAPQMRPTPLQALDPPIRLQPIARGYALVRIAQQFLGET